jgi:hypothetical protein
MSRKRNGQMFKITLELLRPILAPMFWVLERGYKILFGRRDVRLSMEEEERLASEIRTALSFLFDEQGGKIVRDYAVQYPTPFDYAFVIVVLDDLRFRFFRGRGELRAYVASGRTPGAWEELPLVLSIIDAGFERRDFSSFSDVAAALKPRMQLLKQAFSEARNPELQQQLSDVHGHERAVIRQWETEINRRLYPK